MAKVTKNQLTEEDDALLADLGVEIEEKKISDTTPEQERIMAGFEEIERFYELHNRLPLNEARRDVFERMYAVRLTKICSSSDCLSLLADLDQYALIQRFSEQKTPIEVDDEALLAELGVLEQSESDITQLTHVKTRAQVRAAAEEVAQRKPCEDFERFKLLFIEVQQELKSGVRVARPYKKDATLSQGAFYIVGGQKAYIAEIGEWFQNSGNKKDARLRVIFDNGTESNLLYRSFQKALSADDLGRRVSEPDAGPLFEEHDNEDETQSGTIYVLRSLSEHPAIKERREVIHKIGVTGGKVKTRITNAKFVPTFLMDEVEVVATYELFHINRSRLERLLHRFFEAAKLDVEVIDRFGQPIVPQEWFLVPLFIIDEVVSKIKDGTLIHYYYDVQNAQLIECN